MPMHSSLMASDQHGGQLLTAMAEFGGKAEDWLDLSTGINPNGWIPDAIPAACWQRLPEANDGLQLVASTYYGSNSLLLTAGSQAAIQALPRSFSCQRVGLFSPGYFEHQQAWQQAGHQIVSITGDQPDLDAMDILVVINPNNPTGKQRSVDQLLSWHQYLADKGGYLVVDEAFIDASPEASLAPFCPRPGLILLRSMGKFFGLAGIRAGAVIAEPLILKRLDQALGPWALSNPSRWVAKQALADNQWQQRARTELRDNSERLRRLLADTFASKMTGTLLFQTLEHPRAPEIFIQLAQRRVLVRLFSDYNILRFGLPADEHDWSRLSQALSEVGQSLITTRTKPRRNET